MPLQISDADARILRAAGPDVLAVVAKVYQIGLADGRREQAELDRPWLPWPGGNPGNRTEVICDGDDT